MHDDYLHPANIESNFHQKIKSSAAKEKNCNTFKDSLDENSLDKCNVVCYVLKTCKCSIHGRYMQHACRDICYWSVMWINLVRQSTVGRWLFLLLVQIET